MSSDLLMWVGADYPWPNDFTEEGRRIGVSKRISRNAIPEIEPGVSRLALIHPKAIVRVTAEGMDLYNLAWELVTEHEERKLKNITDQDMDEYITQHLICLEENQSMSGLTFLLREAEFAKDLERLEEKYGIEYFPGVFGWAPLTGIHYCLKDDESGLPEDLEGVVGVKIVRMDYSEEANDG